MIEQTLVLLKPDAIQRNLIGEIISRFERVGLKIIGMKMVYPDEKLADAHYAASDEWLESVGEKQRKSFAEKGITLKESNKELGLVVKGRLVDYLRHSPIIALVLEGHNAIATVRKLVGATSPQDSAPGTIRGDYSFDTYQLSGNQSRSIFNLIHASSEVDEATREIGLWFKSEELHAWRRIDEEILYYKGEKQ